MNSDAVNDLVNQDDPPDCKGQDVKVVSTALHEFAESLGKAVDAKDVHTHEHSEEVAVIAHTLALGIGLPAVQADIVHIAAHLHDVGKIGVPDAVLLKKGPLTEDEKDIIRRHPSVGADIVRPVRILRECGVLEMILHHHERYDGYGYPEGISGDQISLGARVIALADSLSAMLQTRPYRKRKTFDEACEEIAQHAGTQFDPLVVSAFFQTRETVRQQLHWLSMAVAAEIEL